jgi:cysteine desulfurase
VVRVTGNFASEAPLSPLAKEALLACIDDGWANPRKISEASSRAAILRDHAYQSIASGLSLSPQQIEVVGESGIGHYLALGGLLTPEARLVHGSTDRSEIFAIAENHLGPVKSLEVDKNGRFLPIENILPGSVLALELANGETGVKHESADFDSVEMSPSLCAIDATTSGTRISLPRFWSTALFDAQSWGGPSGLAILAIKDERSWKNPLPHISQQRVPNTYSLPLLVSAAVALENYTSDSEAIRTLTKRLRKSVTDAIPQCDVAGEIDESLEHITSFSFLYCEGEELVRALSFRGFSVDSGSACIAMNLQPSHVLAAMGVLTHGNIRITIHPGTSLDEVQKLESAIIESVRELRGNI